MCNHFSQAEKRAMLSTYRQQGVLMYVQVHPPVCKSTEMKGEQTEPVASALCFNDIAFHDPI
ncbi:hypothetical protein MPTK1_8g11070 [Marchantia polymorpha subsp. ruderalis]|uniref:Uncharacterized protein n=1 Tax=Marchantia polymorpha TaxID=3197 RepID=A0A2R6XML8_MARPO|nr:hypothetical protein MARPO_0008s0113 [Marchantia polymorpha]BBN19486.1 hypothetical protein Mp_8g11070 [Marchantia polymorpha subsp. ruderalis]|eukprot:PTQ47342.1 hypothetical protein MARPO_0008s0113 [Marchantia polymorpha]